MNDDDTSAEIIVPSAILPVVTALFPIFEFDTALGVT